MSLCRNCIHADICEYRTIRDIEMDCKDFIHVDCPVELLKEFITRIKPGIKIFGQESVLGWSFCKAIPIDVITDTLKEMGISIHYE